MCYHYLIGGYNAQVWGRPQVAKLRRVNDRLGVAIEEAKKGKVYAAQQSFDTGGG